MIPLARSREPLARLPGVRRAGEVEVWSRGTVASGEPALDDALPGGGWPRGAAVELQLAGPGIGELSLLAPALARVAAAGLIAFVDPPAEPCLAMLGRHGVPADAVLVVRGAPDDAQWAGEQLLRAGAAAAVLRWLPAPASDRMARRLGRAAEEGGGLCFLFSPPHAGALTVPLRLRLDPRPRGLQVVVLKRRGPAVAPVRVDLSHALVGAALSPVAA